MKIKAFSKHVPLKFKLFNLIILLPIVAWPLIFFMSIFIFDDPTNDETKVTLIFFGVNSYPIWLVILFEINSRIYLKSKSLAYIMPLIFVGLIFYIVSLIYKDNEESKKWELMRQKQEKIDAEYFGKCRTFRLKNDSVCYNGIYMKIADPKSFKPIDCNFARDTKNAYYHNTIIKNCNVHLLQSIDEYWSHDYKNYFYKGKLIKNIHFESFQILLGDYSKDNFNVYYKWNTIKAADSETFSINSNDPDLASDINNNYNKGEIINNR